MHLALLLPSTIAARRPFLPFQRPAPVAAGRVVRAMPKDAIHRESRPLGLTIRCDVGCVWLTHDGDARDVVLQRGQSHTCDRASRLVVQALEIASITTSPAMRA